MAQDTMFSSYSKPHVKWASIFDLQCGERFDFPLHKHEDMSELLYITNGEGIFHIDGRTYAATAPAILFYNQGIWHEEHSESKKPFVAYYVAYEGLQRIGLPHNFFTGPDESPLIDVEGHEAMLNALIQTMIDEKNSDAPESDLIADQTLGLLLAQISRFAHAPKYNGRKPSSVVEAVHKAKWHIHNFYHEAITLEDLSKTTFLSPYYLAHVFKKELGASPIQYLIHFRIEVAKHYLISTDETVERIAALVGYQSETYFQNIFKKHTGISPGKYRAEGRSAVTHI